MKSGDPILRPGTAPDESLEDSVNPEDPVVLADEIIGDLKPALEQFEGMAGELGMEESTPPSLPYP